MVCVSCKAELQADDRFCAQCGAAQPGRCAGCQGPTPPGARFCPHCGLKLTGGPQPAPAADPPGQPGPERRHMTVMFCDLAGSTALAARLDPEDYHQLVNIYYEIVAAEVARFDGYVARHVGDGVLVYFGYPLAHEDDSERAIRAGLAITTRVGALPPQGGQPCQVRIGIATGLVVVDVIGHGSGTERTISGTTPNLAARLQALAQPQTVVIAPSTYALVSDVFEFRDRGEQALKGLDPVLVREVVKPKSRDDRRLAMIARSAPLIGRSDELGVLMRRWTAALTGDGGCVLVSGDPGIGKSRIVQAFADRIADDHPHLIYVHGSAHHEDSALFPIIAALGHAAEILPEDGPEVRASKAAHHFSKIAELDDVERTMLVELASGDLGSPRLIGTFAPRHRMERRLDALANYLAALSRRQPILIIVEDAHWIDPSSRELIRQFIDRIVAALPALIIVTARPSFQPDWLNLAQVTLLHVNRLSRRDGAALVRQVVGSEELDQSTIEVMVERADGVPLFLEELTRTVVEDTRATGAGSAWPTSAAPKATIPATLQASLLARLDRLSVARELAQEAASIGREFALELIAAVTDRAEEELMGALGQLELAGLLLRRGLPPRMSYYFKHALMQDAAYETLTRQKREALHKRIAEIYEMRFQDIVETRPEILAHHLQQAKLDERAVEAWLKAATRSMARGATAEAVTQIKRGLVLIERVADDALRPRLELPLQLSLGNAFMAARGYTDPETEAAFRRARELCEELGDTEQLMRIAWGTFTRCFAGGHLRSALAEADELLALAERRHDVVGIQIGRASAGAAQLHLGNLAEAEVQLRRALDIAVPDQRAAAFLYGQSGRVTALAYLGLAMLLQGDPRSAAEFSNQAISEAMGLGHPTTLCFARSVACRTAFLRNDDRTLARLGEQVVRESEEQGLPLWRALGAVYRGWSQAQDGRLDDAIASIRQGLAAYRAIGAGLSIGLYLATLGTLESDRGRHQAALDLLDQAQRAAEGSSEVWIMPEICRRRGDALGAAGFPAEAEAELRAGLSLAQGHGDALWRPRLLESLTRVFRDDRAAVAE